MSNAINNLRVNGQEVKKIYFNGKLLKEFYYNGILIWKNANSFLFTPNIKTADLSSHGSDTIIFENFSPTNFTGSYNYTENAESEKPNLTKGQMVVETTDGE